MEKKIRWGVSSWLIQLNWRNNSTITYPLSWATRWSIISWCSLKTETKVPFTRKHSQLALTFWVSWIRTDEAWPLVQVFLLDLWHLFHHGVPESKRPKVISDKPCASLVYVDKSVLFYWKDSNLFIYIPLDLFVLLDLLYQRYPKKQNQPIELQP